MSNQLHRVAVTCTRLLRGSDLVKKDDNLRAADLDKISTLCLNDLKIMLLSRWEDKMSSVKYKLLELSPNTSLDIC